MYHFWPTPDYADHRLVYTAHGMFYLYSASPEYTFSSEVSDHRYLPSDITNRAIPAGDTGIKVIYDPTTKTIRLPM